MKLLNMALALCLVSACSVTTAGNQKNSSGQRFASASPSDGISIAGAKEHFVDAVVSACGDYFATSGLDISKAIEGTSLELIRLKAGSRWPGGIVTGMPVHQVKDSIVYIKENLIGASCEVSSYGLPVDDTFDTIAKALLASGKDYAEIELSREPGENEFPRTFERPFRDIRIQILLTGNEPGTAGTLSRFSTLSARVSFSSLAE